MVNLKLDIVYQKTFAQNVIRQNILRGYFGNQAGVQYYGKFISLLIGNFSVTGFEKYFDQNSSLKKVI